MSQPNNRNIIAMELVNEQNDEEDYFDDEVYVDENGNIRFVEPPSQGRVVAEFQPPRPPSPTYDAAPAA